MLPCPKNVSLCINRLKSLSYWNQSISWPPGAWVHRVHVETHTLLPALCTLTPCRANLVQLADRGWKELGNRGRTTRCVMEAALLQHCQRQAVLAELKGCGQILRDTELDFALSKLWIIIFLFFFLENAQVHWIAIRHLLIFLVFPSSYKKC